MTATIKACQGYVRTEIRAERAGSMRRLIHFWYNTWPDHGVPKGPDKKIFPNDLVGWCRFSLCC